jgi:multisubunit Na+/H+ antiporter MnhG subunit
VRAQQKYRHTHYPGRPWTIGVGLFAAASFVGWLAVNDASQGSSLSGAMFVVFLIATIAAVTLSKQLRQRNDRDNPMSEADRDRLALIDGAVSISPPAGPNPIGAVLTFKNETFAQVFAAANSPGQWMKGL